MRIERQARLLAGLAYLLALVWAGYLGWHHVHARASFLDRLEASFVDWRYLGSGKREPPQGVAILAIDDAAARQAKALPLPRTRIAALIDTALSRGAKAVAIDLLFLDPSSPENDGALAQAVANRPVVIAAALDLTRGAGGEAMLRDCGLPIEDLRRVASVGFVNLSTDASGVPRHVPMLLGCGGSLLPALTLRAVSLATGVDPGFEADAVAVGAVRSALDVGHNLAVRFYGPEGTVPTFSAAEALDGSLPADAVKDKIVLIGVTAAGTGDRFPSPFDSALPGVEVLATAIANLQAGDGLVRTPTIRRLDAGLAIVLALAAVLCLTLRSIEIGLGLLAALVAAVMAGVFLAFSQGYWFAAAMPLAAVTPVAAFTGAGRLAFERWTADRLRRAQSTLGKFQSPAILAQLERRPDFLSVPVERVIAAVFVDLTGFTGLSERLTPLATRELIGAFHTIVEVEVERRGGIVATYMGDGAMIVWGLMDDQTPDSRLAIETGFALETACLDWLKGVNSTLGTAVSVKVGAHRGPAVLSRLGHASHQHITAIGDTVNVAARLMEVASENHVRIAMSLDLVEAARAEDLDPGLDTFAEPQEAAIRGRQRPVAVCFVPLEGAA